jgi:hypothetical protein
VVSFHCLPIGAALQGVRMQNPSKIDATGPARISGESSMRRWQDVVELAQVDLAHVLARSIALGRFDRGSYQNWLAMESVLCRIGALSLDAVASWHGSQPAWQAAAQTWAARLREDARTAAHDVRVLDGVADASPAALGAWHAFAVESGGSQRAGEALGTVLLHDRLIDGPMRPVAITTTELPFVVGSQYLRRRLAAPSGPEQCAELLDAYAAASLAAGAQRAAHWYAAAMADVLRARQPD